MGVRVKGLAASIDGASAWLVLPRRGNVCASLVMAERLIMRSVCFITSIRALLPALINTYIVDTGTDIVRVVGDVFVFWLFCFL